MRTVILAGLAVLLGAASPLPLDASALTATPQAAYTFDPAALQGICGDIRSKNSARYEWRVETAAGVLPSDSAAEIRAKASAMFAEFQPQCSGFNVSRGGVLKYAVASRTYDFVYLAVSRWGFDLNVIDASDGRTVLDYVNDEMAKNLGRPAEAEFVSYRDLLTRAGARTTAQLNAGEDCRPSTRCRQ